MPDHILYSHILLLPSGHLQSQKWILKEGVSDNSKVIGASYLRPGALKLQNMNEGDGENQDYRVDDNDRVKIGDTNPVATGGFNTSNSKLTSNFINSLFMQNANQLLLGPKALVGTY